jgi:hypothetical protein
MLASRLRGDYNSAHSSTDNRIHPKEGAMPDETVQDVVFDVGVTQNDQLRAAWQKAKARYAPELAAKRIDFSKGLGPALDKWSVSYKTFNKSRFSLARGNALWTKLQPVAQARIKSEAKALQTDARAVAKAAGKYLAAVEALGDPDNDDDPGHQARKDLTTILTKIAQRAADHDRQAAKTLKARAR